MIFTTETQRHREEAPIMEFGCRKIILASYCFNLCASVPLWLKKDFA